MTQHPPTAADDGPSRGPARSRGGLRHGPVLALLLLTTTLIAGCGGGGPTATTAGVTTTSAGSQMEFGVRMAQQGLWSEALFRFRQAARMAPNDFRVYNNMAVAYEATGQFEEALQAYQQALQMASDNRDLRRNYARFAEFYQSFRPQPEGQQAGEPGQGAGPGGAANGAGTADGGVRQSRRISQRDAP